MHKHSSALINKILCILFALTFSLVAFGEEISGTKPDIKSLEIYGYQDNSVRGSRTVAQSLTTLPRQFTGRFTKSKRIDSVYFDSARSLLIVCLESRPENCRRYQTDASEIVPAVSKKDDTHQVLIEFSKDGLYRKCEISSRSGLLCDAANMADFVSARFVAGRHVVSMSASPDSYTCSYPVGGPAQCNSARSLSNHARSLAFGHFSQNNDIEMLSFRDGNAELCTLEISRVICAPVSGLNRFAQAGVSSPAYDSRTQRSVLFGVFHNAIVVCSYRSKSNPSAFSCSEETVKVNSDIVRPVVLTTRSKSGKPIREWLSLSVKVARQTADSNSPEIAEAKKVVDAFVSASQQAGVPRFGSSSNVSVQSRLIEFEYDEDEESYVPQNLQAELDYGPRFSLWSDSFGSLAWEWWASTATKTLTQCLDDCKSEFDMDVGRCSMYEADVAFAGLWVTSVATLVVVITPGLGVSAPVVLAGGVGASASVSSMVGSFCRSGAYSRWASCQSWARRSC
jgi:hypothetical protein